MLKKEKFILTNPKVNANHFLLKKSKYIRIDDCKALFSSFASKMEIENKIIHNLDNLELQNVEDTISTTGKLFQNGIHQTK
jgi:hypothetical protein